MAAMNQKPYLPFLTCLLLMAAPVSARQNEYDGEDQQPEDELEQEFELLQLEDEQVVYSASRHRQKKQLSPSSITVVTRSQINTAGAFSVVDILRRVPGMEVIVVSPGFTAVNARLPSTYENHLFLVLIDGREVNNWVLGQAFWEMQLISADDIERIEIIRGPASAVYGANAFAGVISITTRAVPQETSALLQIEGGSWSWLNTLGRVSNRWGDLGFSAGAGYEYNGDFGNSGILGKRAVKGRGMLEFRSGQDFFLRFDANGGQGKAKMPTAVGQIDGLTSSLTATLNLEHRRLRGRINYSYYEISGHIDTPMEYNGLRLAHFAPLSIGWQDLDAEVQWTLPRWWKPLTLIAGGGMRGTWSSCPNCLDSKSFSDPLSARYHQPGAEYSELRAGAFVHAELLPLQQLQISASGRADYNTDSGLFLSPRLAAVAEVAPDHYLRLSASRAFRKLTYMERHLHPLVYFTEESPLQGGDRTLFLEFMSRVIGNEQLPDETIWAFELGYDWNRPELGLEAGAVAYLNIYSKVSSIYSDIKPTLQGLPDLRNSSVRYELDGEAAWIAGVESYFNYSPLDWLTLRGAWSYRYVWFEPGGGRNDKTPSQIYSLGAEFTHNSGFLGSLYFSGRSSSLDTCDNPRGIMEPLLSMKLPLQLLLLSRVGYRARFQALQMETGVKLMLPLNLSGGAIGFHEHAGGVTPEGTYYGGSELQTSMLFYLNANF